MVGQARIENGVYFPDFELSELEKHLFQEFEIVLRSQGFKYLAVPIALETSTLKDQAVATNENAYWLDGDHFLNGSAEQGILEFFRNRHVTKTTRVYAYSHCFRRESALYGLARLKEFKKLEQFSFVTRSQWAEEFDRLLSNATNFLNRFGIKHRVVDVTERDPGYHLLKKDIEIHTEQYGWLESHSCTYFGREQAKRFGITGVQTISNTGIASPRILIPFIERGQ